MMNKPRAARNRTIRLSVDEENRYKRRLITLDHASAVTAITNKTICQDVFAVLDKLPAGFIDLAFIDPPYNLNKTFKRTSFKAMTTAAYQHWLDSWLGKMLRLLTPTASLYICGDWRSSAAIFNIASKYFIIQNRITFEREKGRGAQSNWKNSAEDIWFYTRSKAYYFNVDAVKLKRKVLAPYRNRQGQAKDWQREAGGNYRLTHPSNIWTDLSIPFWSMPENTEHPTQKPEKLLAKIILASSRPGAMVFDPFLGSGTTSVVAKKLGRRYVGIEIDEDYAALAEKRLAMAESDSSIQGYFDQVFWERNTLNQQTSQSDKTHHASDQTRLFDDAAP